MKKFLVASILALIILVLPAGTALMAFDVNLGTLLAPLSGGITAEPARMDYAAEGPER